MVKMKIACNKRSEKRIKINKQNKMTRTNRKQKGGAFITLNLNKSYFIDLLGVNNVKLFFKEFKITKDEGPKANLSVIKLTPERVLWRGYTQPCVALTKKPGCIDDNFKKAPVWYGGPEVAVIYTALGFEAKLIQTFLNYKRQLSSLDVPTKLKEASHLITSGYSSILAYSVNEPCYLIDINNTQNLDLLIQMFNLNWDAGINYQYLLTNAFIDKRTDDKVKELFTKHSGKNASPTPTKEFIIEMFRNKLSYYFKPENSVAIKEESIINVDDDASIISKISNESQKHQSRGVQNIGFDFDGVIYKSVKLVDNDWRVLGYYRRSRFIPSKKIVKVNPNYIILNLIKKYISEGKNIFIISERSNSEKIIFNYLKYYKIHIKLENILCSNGGSKVHILSSKNINEYYDDTCQNLIDIKTSHTRSQLPNLKCLYLVRFEHNIYNDILRDPLFANNLDTCFNYIKNHIFDYRKRLVIERNVYENDTPDIVVKDGASTILELFKNNTTKIEPCDPNAKTRVDQYNAELNIVEQTYFNKNKTRTDAEIQKMIREKNTIYEQFNNNRIAKTIAEYNKVINSGKISVNINYSHPHDTSKPHIEFYNGGYIINLINGGYVVCSKIEEGKYKLFINYNIITPKYTNIQNGTIDETNGTNPDVCTFCHLCKSRSWVTSTKKGVYSHNMAEAENYMYYNKLTPDGNVIPTALIFENTFATNKPVTLPNLEYSKNEERILSIPYVHLLTKDKHPKCNAASGVYHKAYIDHLVYISANKPGCGALLYSDEIDEEILFYFMNTYEATLAYAHRKYGKPFKIPEIDYTRASGRFYKYKEPLEHPHDNSYGKIFMNFHCLENSVEHIHLHSWIDSQNTNLFDFMNSGRFTDDRNIGKALANNAYYLTNASEYIYDIRDKDSIIKHGERKTSDMFVEDVFLPELQSKISPDKLYTACSFQFLIKRILGIPDISLVANSGVDNRLKEIMMHEWIFPEPNYQTESEIFEKDNKFAEDYIKKMTELRNTYKDNCTTTISGPIDKNPNLKLSPSDDANVKSTIKTIYLDLSDNNNLITKLNSRIPTMQRHSTTDGDNVMIILMIIALFNNPEIGGYYGCASPISNSKMQNITHPEICLFNLVNYPVNILKNTNYTSCCDPELEDTMNYTIFTLYFMYHIQYQNNFNVDAKFKKNPVNLLMNFLYSDVLNFRDNLLNDDSDTEFDDPEDNQATNQNNGNNPSSNGTNNNNNNGNNSSSYGNNNHSNTENNPSSYGSSNNNYKSGRQQGGRQPSLGGQTSVKQSIITNSIKKTKTYPASNPNSITSDPTNSITNTGSGINKTASNDLSNLVSMYNKINNTNIFKVIQNIQDLDEMAINSNIKKLVNEYNNYITSIELKQHQIKIDDSNLMFIKKLVLSILTGTIPNPSYFQ